MKALINAVAMFSFILFLSFGGLWVYALSGGKTLQKRVEITPVGSMVVVNDVTFGADQSGVGYAHRQTIYNYLLGSVNPPLMGKFDPAGEPYARELAATLRQQDMSWCLTSGRWVARCIGPN